MLMCVHGYVWARGAVDREGGCAYFGDVKSKISQLTVSRQGGFIQCDWRLASVLCPVPAPTLGGGKCEGEARTDGMRGGQRGVVCSFYHSGFCWPGLSWNHCCRPASSRQLPDSKLFLLIENLELIKCIHLKS